MADLKHEITLSGQIMPRKAFEQHASRILGLQSGISKNDSNVLLVHLSRDKKQLKYTREVISPQPLANVYT